MSQYKNIHLSSFLLVLCYLLTFFAYWYTQNNPFFWDTIQLGSKHAHFYYENNFQYFLLPENIDSGHPPFFGMYLAGMWKLFGQNLAVSHFAILPFSLLSLGLLYAIGNYFLGEQKGIWLVILMMADPTFAAQNSLISPDAVVMSFFLLGLYAILFKKKILLVLAAIGLAAMSMRGMMIVVILYVLECYQNQSNFSVKSLFKSSLVFFPAGLLALAFLTYHYQQTGWIGYHEDSPWAASFEKVDFKGFIKNIGVYIWRMLDFGRVFVMLALIILLFLKWKRITRSHLRNNEPRLLFLLIFLLFSILLLSPSLLIHKYLTAHRYLLPIYFACSLLMLYLLFKMASRKWLPIFYTIIFLGLATGSFWIYPPKVAQGWDATLAHLPYYKLRAEMIGFIEKEQLDFEDIGSVFPEVGARKFRELNDMEVGFLQANLLENQYIFYSNVMNDFSDAEMEELSTNWEILKRIEANGVFVLLYQKLMEEKKVETLTKMKHKVH